MFEWAILLLTFPHTAGQCDAFCHALPNRKAVSTSSMQSNCQQMYEFERRQQHTWQMSSSGMHPPPTVAALAGGRPRACVPAGLTGRPAPPSLWTRCPMLPSQSRAAPLGVRRKCRRHRGLKMLLAAAPFFCPRDVRAGLWWSTAHSLTADLSAAVPLGLRRPTVYDCSY